MVWADLKRNSSNNVRTVDPSTEARLAPNVYTNNEDMPLLRTFKDGSNFEIRIVDPNYPRVGSSSETEVRVNGKGNGVQQRLEDFLVDQMQNYQDS